MNARNHDSERGFVTSEFVLSVALLIFPVALLVLTLPTWAERQSMSRVSAREAARTYVLTADEVRARESAVQIATNQRIDPASISVSFEGDPRVAGSEVRATVITQVPAVRIPLLGAGIGSFELSDTHTEIVDLYRSQPL